MASQSRSDASRANGAKSKGPSSPEGKAQSSQKTARFDFDALLEAHLAQYRPSGAVENELVHTLAITRWRLRRVPVLESEIFKLADDRSLSPSRRTSLRSRQAFSLLMRYETSLLRTYERTFKHLAELQKLRNEPKPP